MDLQRNSQEIAHITFSVPVGVGTTIEASIDLHTWTPVTTDTNGLGLVLLRGPDSGETEGLLVPGRCELWIRITDSPEVIVRSAGWIVLY